MWIADNGDGTYRNPVLYADYSDPDVIRVGDTYYMTASSFQYTPGLPILTSKDLVNWTLANYALENLPFDAYRTPQHAKGIWAPAIRHHDGMFWIFVGLPDEGIFMTRTRDPLGVWAPLQCVMPGKGLIDPCPLWDDDGRAYVVHAFAKSRTGFNSVLSVFEMAADGSRALGETRHVFDGTKTQPVIEGPKLYKREGLYYILAPAGGVTDGWQTALRSDSIWGPYEELVVMHQGRTAVNGPHQGGLVDDIQGGEWFLHFQDKGVAGRIPHLQPVTWVDGWPIIGAMGEDGIGEPVASHRKPPCVENVTPVGLGASDDFASDTLSLQWQWQANHHRGFYDLTAEGLRLHCWPHDGQAGFPLRRAANVLTEKLVMPSFVATVGIDISGLGVGACGGLALLGSQCHCLCVERGEHGYRLSSFDDIGGEEHWHLLCELTDTQKDVSLRLTYTANGMQFAYAVADAFLPAGDPFAMRNDTWVGGKLGLFALAREKEGMGSVLFRHVIVEQSCSAV